MTYNLLKLLHLFAVVIFLGNIITGLYWMRIAIKTRDLKIISHSVSGVIKSDRLFTIPGVIVITIGGFLAAIDGGIPILRTGWIFWSLVLFTISGLAFALKVVPLQARIRRITQNHKTEETFDWGSVQEDLFSLGDLGVNCTGDLHWQL